MRPFMHLFLPLVLAGCVSAQTTSMAYVGTSTVRFPQLPQHYRTTAQESTHRYWYWEIDDSIRVPFPTYNYLPHRMMAVEQGFSPATLSWNFTGKYKFMPSLDLTIVQIKPGEPIISISPDAQYGVFELKRSAKLWAKATQSLMAALRY